VVGIIKRIQTIGGYPVKATAAQLKEIRELIRDKKSRDESGLFVAEGFKALSDIAEKRCEIKYILSVDEEMKNNLSLRDKNTQFFTTTVSSFEKLSNLKNPDGILAVLKKRDLSIEDIFTPRKHCSITVCDGLQDPANLGSIIRSAAAFGSDFLLITGSSVDIYNPKVVRSASGTLFDIAVMHASYADIARLKADGYKVYAGKSHGANSTVLSDIKLSPKMIIVLGSEGQGISNEMAELTDIWFHIPISDKVESLNVNAAAAIALYETIGREYHG